MTISKAAAFHETVRLGRRLSTLKSVPMVSAARHGQLCDAGGGHARRCREYRCRQPPGSRRVSVRGRPRQCATVVREHQVCRVENSASGAGRVSNRFRRALSGTPVGVYLRSCRARPWETSDYADAGAAIPPLETTYTWENENGATRMALRNRGTPSGFSAWLAPLMSLMVERVSRKDLAALKRHLEGNVP